MTDSARPLVSVVIPAFNAAACLGRSIDSVLAQTYRPFEVVVVDDGSRDATLAVAAGYGPPVRVVDQPNRGVSAARNLGIRHAVGELIAFLDADDSWYPEKLELQVAALEAAAHAGACITEIENVDVSGRTLGFSDYAACFPSGEFGLTGALECFSFLCSYLMVRRDVLDRVGAFDEGLRTAEDIDLVVRIATRSRVLLVSRPLLRYQLGEGSLSGALFTGNRLRVLEKLRRSRALPNADRGLLQRTCARVHLSYGEDLLWHGDRARARAQLAASLRTRPSSRAAYLLGKSLLPTGLIQRLRAMKEAAATGLPA